jgi:hypothetical protein
MHHIWVTRGKQSISFIQKPSMKNAGQRYEISYVLLLSLGLILFSTCQLLSALEDLDFSPSYPCFENVDQQDSIVPREEKRDKNLELAYRIKEIRESSFSPERRAAFLPQAFPIHFKSPVLRC